MISFAKLFGGDTGSVELRPSGVSFRAEPGKSILESALAKGIAFPHSCTVGTCGSCKCRLKEGKIRELTDFAYILSAEELRSDIILACQAAARGDVVIEIEGIESKRLHPTADVRGVIATTERLTHDVMRVVVTLDDPLAFDAGQYALIDLPEIFGKRAYSFACIPEPDGASEVEFWIRHVPGGAFTDLLFSEDLRGREVKVHGPLGNFWLRDGGEAIVCIAGGSGLAPILSMLERAARNGEKRACALLFGARAQRDLYALDRIEAIAAQWGGPFAFTPVLSDESADSEWKGRRGLVTAFVESAFGGRFPASAQAYLCGPTGMIDSAIPILKGVSIPPKDIHFDKFLDARDNIRRQA